MTISPTRKVSVIVPNYNYARFLKKRIKSIVDQTYPIYELIILDDCSTDGSREVIDEIIQDLRFKNPNLRVRFIENNKNTGKAIVQWKKGFELARGDYVWIAEADDLSKRKFLEEVMKGFDDSDVVLSYSESAIINSKGIMIVPNFRWSRDKERTGHYKKNYIRNGEDEIGEIMAIRCAIPNVSAVVFKKVERIPYRKYLDEAMRYSQVGDWYFYVKVLENGKICYNRKVLNYFRIHRKSVTNKSKSENKHYYEIRELHSELKKNYELNDVVVKRMDNELRRVKIEHGIKNAE